MPDGAAPMVAGVTVTIAKDPALVRTVRLVAAAVARRTGGDDEFVEEVRLAVGEACALLIGTRDGEQTSSEPVTVTMLIDGKLSVDVAATGSVPGSPTGSPAGDFWLDTGAIEPWALLRGLVDDFEIARDGAVTTVSMSWPAA